MKFKPNRNLEREAARAARKPVADLETVLNAVAKRDGRPSG